MTRKITNTLRNFESYVTKGDIASFKICISHNGINIKTENTSKDKEVLLIREILDPIRVFFSGIEVIEYNSFDYISLKSFLNTTTC
ncbi:hypothetical protein [Pontibacter chitinilyticus]|uniref:hypothetical protein n=1 Tax=Pontibacter chitinilyticus TaxID=2674989 RepID=UPI00321C2DC4